MMDSTIPNKEGHLTLTTDQPQEEVLYPKEEIGVVERKGCRLDCGCEKCKALGYTEDVVVQNLKIFVFGGPIMLRLPVSNFYQMVGYVSLNYLTFHEYQIKNIVKLKALHVDSLPGLKKIFLTLKPGQKKVQVTVNAPDMTSLFDGLIRTRLFSSNQLGIPYRKFEGKLLGKVWIKNGSKGWSRRSIEITDRLRIEGEKKLRQLKEFWTRFDLIDVEGLCLVFKFWDFFTKLQIGIPIKQLSTWISAFLTLVKD